MMGITYHITKEDQDLIAEQSEGRDSGKPNTCHNGSVSAEESKQRHDVGLKGEVAFGNTYGLDLDKRHYPSGDCGYDFVLTTGLKIDVKTRSLRSGDDLALDSDSLVDVIADVFVLAHEQGRKTISLIGWTYPLRLHYYGRIENLEGPRLLESPESLRPMSEFEQIMAS